MAALAAVVCTPDKAQAACVAAADFDGVRLPTTCLSPEETRVVRLRMFRADLAVAAALLSAREDTALPAETVIFGEISLSGALRPVGQTENRLKEAQKLGFTTAIVPSGGKTGGDSGLSLTRMGDLVSFVGEVFGAG